MLGSTVFRLFSTDDRYTTFGTLRSAGKRRHFTFAEQKHLIPHVDVEKDSDLLAVFSDTKPDMVINCVGIIKQLDAAHDPLITLAINSTLPHRLAQFCRLMGARLVHMSTDCVFSGSKGNYTESDFADADDLYGRTKYLGEVDYPHAITLRTSIIGHELESAQSLIDWFLSQSEKVRGYRNAIFSGLPTIEIARVIRDFVLPRPDLTGVYHLSANPISKYNLLMLVAKVYGKDISITPDEAVVIDRSLNSDRFRRTVNYHPDDWFELVSYMHGDYEKYHAEARRRRES